MPACEIHVEITSSTSRVVRRDLPDIPKIGATIEAKDGLFKMRPVVPLPARLNERLGIVAIVFCSAR